MLNVLNLTSILLLMSFIQTKNVLFRNTLSDKESSPGLQQQFQCAYGGGTINNSTVIELGNCYNDLYYIGLTLGTGTPQTFYFQFDTGSPTLWVPLGSPPSGYNQSLSTTYSTTTQQNNLTYGDGSYANGYMGNDIVAIKGTPISGNGSIEWANNVSANIWAGAPDVQGLVGMDYASTPNFLDVAYNQNQISTPIFSLELNDQTQTSYLYYNNGLPASITNSMVWIPQQSNQNGYWQAGLTTVKVGGLDVTSVAATYAVIDSGTSLSVLNTGFYNKIVQLFFSTAECFNDQNNSNMRTCYCNNTWPDFVFNFSSTSSLNLSASLYKQPATQPGYCYVNLQYQSDPQIILGDIFFRAYIVTFDRINNQMGFYYKPTQSSIPTPLIAFNPIYFAAAQFVLTALYLILVVTGVGLAVKAGRQMRDSKVEHGLGREMM